MSNSILASTGVGVFPTHDGQRHGPLCHPFGIRGYGNPEYGVVVVGIAPGRDEIEKSKRPFTGNSGQLLDNLLAFVGWPREKVYTTNTICWWNNKPSEVDIEGCGPRFRRELDDLKPKLIVTAGAIANETVMGMKRKKGSRGAVVWNDRFKCYVLDTHHPSFALQSQSMSAVQDIIRDLAKIPDILDWPANGEGARVVYKTVESLDEAQWVLDNLPKAPVTVTLDIETSNPDAEAIDAYSDTLLVFGVSFALNDGSEVNIVFPERIFPLCVRDGTHVRRWARQGYCEGCSIPGPYALTFPIDSVHWTFQSGAGDIAGINAYFGQQLPLKDDTMLMSVCADERPGYHGLKSLAREYIGAGWYEEEIKPFYKGKMHLLSPEQVEAYNAKDVAYDRRLVPILRKKMEEDGTTGLYENILRPAMQTFINMQIRGINVDQKVLQDLAYENWFPRYIEMHRDLQLEAQEIGWPTDDINFNSSPQLRKLFFNIIGVEPTKWSQKTGAPSLDKETLDKMDHPFAAKIRAFRQLDGMIDYVMAVYNHMKHDGLLHPSASVATTRTGRTSYRDPAMQTLPKDYTVGADYARLREIIIPHNPETHEILESDYEQIEVWLAWAWSKDPILHEHLLSGDVHSATAEGAFKTKRELWSKEEWDQKRQNAKKIRFGIQYGEGAEKLASPPPVGIGSTVREAQTLISQYRSTYPTYTAWMAAIQREAMNNGYLRLPSGRVMRFPVVMDHKQLRQAINFPIQGTASEYNLISMIELAPLLLQYNSWIILNIHDSLVIEADRRYRPQIMALVREVMERPKFPGFPSVRVDMKVGDNLGKVAKIK